jgi:hypothetical protein
MDFSRTPEDGETWEGEIIAKSVAQQDGRRLVGGGGGTPVGRGEAGRLSGRGGGSHYAIVKNCWRQQSTGGKAEGKVDNDCQDGRADNAGQGAPKVDRNWTWFHPVWYRKYQNYFYPVQILQSQRFISIPTYKMHPAGAIFKFAVSLKYYLHYKYSACEPTIHNTQHRTIKMDHCRPTLQRLALSLHE